MANTKIRKEQIELHDGTDYTLDSDVNVSKVDPKIKLTDTGNDNYTKITKSDTTNLSKRVNVISKPAKAVSGGDSSYTVGDYTVQVFNSSGTLSVTGGTVDVDVLIVAGGGGGGGQQLAGGGGAGGYIYLSSQSLSGSYPLTVGAGGTGGSGIAKGNNGGNSSFNGSTAVGGGGGGSYLIAGANGGSGGGAGYGRDYGNGTVDQGNRGGTYSPSAPYYGAGGGGGAGAVGQGGTSTKGGNGGVGVDYSTEFGTSVGENGYFAGGGGGAVYGAGTVGSGGTGGGADGSNTHGIDATANTGGGGGGGERDAGGNTGGDGGSGIVLVRYLTSEVSNTDVESTVWSSQDGVVAGERGINTFGDSEGKTILDAGTGIYVNDNLYLQSDADKLYLGAGDDFSISFDGTAPLLEGISTATVATDDKVLVNDTSDSDRLKTVTAQSIADLAGGTPSASTVYLGSDQTATANSWTKVNYNTEVYDNLGEFNTTSNRFTADADGYYQINAHIDLVSTSSAYTYWFVYRINNSQLSGERKVGTSKTYDPFAISNTEFLNAGDYIDFWVYASNANKTIKSGRLTAYASITKVA